MLNVKLIALIFLLASNFASATCYEEAGQRFGVDPVLLRSIAWQESRGNPSAVGPRLADGNHAIGVMGINTIHLGTLEPVGITREKLFEPCTSVLVGAQVLADCIKRFGQTWKAVGCYNTGPASNNVDAQQRYMNGVSSYYDEFLHNPNAKPHRKKRAASPAQREVVRVKVRAPKPAPLTMKIWDSDE